MNKPSGLSALASAFAPAPTAPAAGLFPNSSSSNPLNDGNGLGVPLAPTPTPDNLPTPTPGAISLDTVTRPFSMLHKTSHPLGRRTNVGLHTPAMKPSTDSRLSRLRRLV